MVIYACRRGLRDRPARNCHCVRVGSGDCGGRMRDEACPGRVTGRGMRPRAVAAGAPDGDRMRAWARLWNSVSFRSPSRILPLKPSSETFHKAMSHEAMPHAGLPGPMSRHSTPWPAHRFRVSPDVGSVPLLRKAIRGIAFRSLPRRSISAASSRAMHRPETDVSGIAARHPRVTPPARFSTRKRRPQASRPCTKSSHQRALRPTPRSGPRPACRSPCGASCACGRYRRGRADGCGESRMAPVRCESRFPAPRYMPGNDGDGSIRRRGPAAGSGLRAAPYPERAIFRFAPTISRDRLAFVFHGGRPRFLTALTIGIGSKAPRWFDLQRRHVRHLPGQGLLQPGFGQVHAAESVLPVAEAPPFDMPCLRHRPRNSRRPHAGAGYNRNRRKTPWQVSR